MELLERESLLDTLGAILAGAATGEGRLVLLGGEAGVGKTSLVRELAQREQKAARALVGSCDPLATPRALGPLLDVAPELGAELKELLARGAARGELFGALLASLGGGRQPDLLVFEDAHWADEATLDLIRFLGRRLGAARVLFLVTYREDEVGAAHPLRLVLGDLSTAAAVLRLSVPPLSHAAVEVLCRGTGLEAGGLHRLTGGNPFYVTEVVAAGASGLPQTVRDAVLARAARLPAQARTTLETAAVIGPRITPRLLAAVVVEGLSGLGECLEGGFLRREGDGLAFRHELARVAVADAIPPERAVALHAAALAALRSRRVGPDDFAQLVHHAQAAGDEEALLEFAPAAAERAAELYAHREAAAHYERALRLGGELSAERRALLLERFAYQSYLGNEFARALDARREAVTLWHSLGNGLKEGENLCAVSRMSLMTGQAAEAEEAGRLAIGRLEQLPPSRELAIAYNNFAWLRDLAWELEQAVDWGERAIALAERLGDKETTLHATITAAGARYQMPDGRGRERVEEALRVAIAAGLEEQAGRAFWTLANACLWQRRHELAARYVDEGVSYCLEHDLESWLQFLLGARARLFLGQGDFAEAEALAADLLRPSEPVVLRRIPTLVVMGRVRARVGVHDPWLFLDEAVELATRAPQMEPFVPVRAARAEAAWLAGDAASAVEEARAGLDDAVRRRDPWGIGELRFWLFRADALPQPPEGAAEPYALALAGDLAGAAAAWRAIGSPYEAAEALTLGEDEAALREALATFERLDARPAATATKRRLRALGVKRIPRGPRAATRANPAGLTERELEILFLLASGLTNPELARRLFLSPKTVEHHVSSILRKLGAESRSAAVAEARRLGVTVQHGASPATR